MNKQLTIILSSLAFVAAIAAQTAASVQAAPMMCLDQSTGLLGSPVAQLPLQDPVIQRAIDWIESGKQGKGEHKFQRRPDTTISRFGADRREMILGGPEVVPM